MPDIRRSVVGLTFVSMLLVGAWVAAADTCGPTSGGLLCSPLTTVAAATPNSLFLTAAGKAGVASKPELGVKSDRADTTNRPQAASLLMLGTALALAGQILKRPGPHRTGD
jgi:hypothetical protein